MSMFRTLIMSKSGRLPSEYQEVEYIGSSGGYPSSLKQYIDTGVIPTSNIGYELKFSTPGTSSSYYILLGSSDGAYGFLCSWEHYNSMSIGKDATTYAVIPAIYNQEHTFLIDKDGNYNMDGDTGIATDFVDSSDSKILLFKSTTNLSANDAFTGELYYCKIFDNDTLVRDYIPCYRKSDKEAGLYDLIGKQFYTNQGTGKFRTAPIEGEYILYGSVSILDAINNTGSGHSSGVTTWKDLSGNNNDFTLSNVTWESNRAVFNGTNSSGVLSLTLGTNQTLEIVCIVTDTVGGEEKSLLANFDNSSAGCFGVQNASYTNGIGYTIYNGSWRDMNMLLTASYEQDKIYTFSVTYDGTTMKGYVDGELTNSFYTPGTISSTTKLLHIMGNNKTSITSGYVYGVRVYDRALTADEIVHNRSVDASKYNIS